MLLSLLGFPRWILVSPLVVLLRMFLVCLLLLRSCLPISSMWKIPRCPLGLFYPHLSRNTSVHLLLHSQLVLDPWSRSWKVTYCWLFTGSVLPTHSSFNWTIWLWFWIIVPAYCPFHTTFCIVVPLLSIKSPQDLYVHYNLLFDHLVQMPHNRWVNPRTAQAPGVGSSKTQWWRKPQRQWSRTSTNTTKTNPLSITAQTI